MSSNKNWNKNKLFGLLSALLITTIFLAAALLFVTFLLPNNIVTHEQVIDKLTRLVPYLIVLFIASVYFLILAFSKKYEVPEKDNEFPEANFYTSPLFELPNEDEISYDYYEFDNEDISKEANYVEEFEPLKALNKKEILAKINHKYGKTYVNGDEKDISTYYVENNNVPNSNQEEDTPIKEEYTPVKEEIKDTLVENIKEKEVVNNSDNLEIKPEIKETKRVIKRIVPKKGDWVSFYYATDEDNRILTNNKCSAVSLEETVLEHYNYTVQHPEEVDDSDSIYIENKEVVADNKSVIYEYDDSVLLDYKQPLVEYKEEYEDSVFSDYKAPSVYTRNDAVSDESVVYKGFTFDPVKAPIITEKYIESKQIYRERVVEEFPVITDTEELKEDNVHSNNVYSNEVYSNFTLPTTKETESSKEEKFSPVPFVYYRGVDIPRTEELYQFPTDEQISLGEFCYKFKPVTASKKEIAINPVSSLCETTPISVEEPNKDDNSIIVHEEKITVSENNNKVVDDIEEQKLNADEYNPYYDDIKLFEEIIYPTQSNVKEKQVEDETETANEAYPNFSYLYSKDKVSPVPFVYYRGVDVPRPVEEYIYPTEEELLLGEFCYKFRPVIKDYSEPIVSEESVTLSEPAYLGFNFDKVNTPINTNKYTETKQEYPEKQVEQFPEIADTTEVKDDDNLYTSFSLPTTVSPVPFEYYEGIDVPRPVEDYIYPTKEQLEKGEFCYKFKPITKDYSEDYTETPITQDEPLYDDRVLSDYKKPDTYTQTVERETAVSKYKGFTFDPVKAPIITNKYTETKQEYPEKEVEQFPEISNNFNFLPSSYEGSPIPFEYYEEVDVPRPVEDYIYPTEEQLEKGEFSYKFKPVTKNYSEPVYATFTDILEVEMEEARKTSYSLSIGKMKSDKLQKYEQIEFDALAVVENKDTMKMIFPMLEKKEAETVVDNMVKKIGGDETISTKFSELEKRNITAEKFDKEIE